MNKRIKVLLSLILCIVLTFSLTGCTAEGDISLHSVVDSLGSLFGFEIPPEADQIIDGVDDVVDGFGELVNGVGGLIDSNTTITNEKLSITMLDVGQGLSILFESNGKYMLYDGGDRGTSSYVVAYLKQNGISELEYIVASHYDSDHIAGLVGVLETTKVKNIINPDCEATSKIYQSYRTAANNSGANIIYPSVGDTFKLGYATLIVLAPARDYGDANEMSVAIKVECEEFSCIVTGDAESESEKDMLNCGIDLNCDLYVVGHHGSSSSSSDSFVKALAPEYGFISCGKDNDYGHPTDKTLATLKKYNVEIYRSDTDGEVTCVTDGQKYKFVS